MTNDDVLGDAIPDDQQREMQKLCYWAVGVVSPLNFDTGFEELVTEIIYCETSKTNVFHLNFIWHEGRFLSTASNFLRACCLIHTNED